MLWCFLLFELLFRSFRALKFIKFFSNCSLPEPFCLREYKSISSTHLGFTDGYRLSLFVPSDKLHFESGKQNANVERKRSALFHRVLFLNENTTNVYTLKFFSNVSSLQ